jgi:hypothetical protein
MWAIALHCNGCGEPFDGYFVLSPANIPRAFRDLERRAGHRGPRWRRWEHVDAPDGEQWFCPSCRRARDGEGPVGAAGA